MTFGLWCRSERQEMTYEEMHAVAQYLYQLLDDIDTATDMAKADDKLYRAIVERAQAKKAAVVAECDGYTVTLRPLTANVEFSGPKQRSC